MLSLTRIVPNLYQKKAILLPLLALVSCGEQNGPTVPLTEAANSPVVQLKSVLPRAVPPTQTDSEIKAAATAVSRFGLTLFSDWASGAGNSQKNVVFSPHSLYSALLMAQTGAESETLRQMSDVLQLTVPQQQANTRFNALDLALEGRGQLPGDGTLRTVNGLFIEKTQRVQASFLDALATNFGAGVTPIETNTAEASEESRLAVNAWFNAHTLGNFPAFFPPASLIGARMVIANAVTFQGAWKTSFDPNLTVAGDFLLETGGRKSAQFMKQDTIVRVKHATDYDAVELPFAGGDFAFQIVVPKVGQLHPVEAVFRATPEFNFLEASDLKHVYVAMPKFKFETNFPVKESLVQLGMINAFQGGLADFSGINNPTSLVISNVVHRATISVDEKGAEASAGTAVIIGTPSARSPSETITVNSPFFFAIRDLKTGLVVFVGRVMDPSV